MAGASTKIVSERYPNTARVIYEFVATGAGAMAESLDPTTELGVGKNWKLLAIFLKMSAAPTTSQNFVATRDRGNGSAYDTIALSQDLSVGGITSLELEFGKDKDIMKSTDCLTLAYTNTDTGTWGLIVLYELL